MMIAVLRGGSLVYHKPFINGSVSIYHRIKGKQHEYEVVIRRNVAGRWIEVEDGISGRIYSDYTSAKIRARQELP